MTRDEWQRAVLTAKMVALDNLKRLEKDPKDGVALEYFHGAEYKRWFQTPPEVSLDGVIKYHRQPIAVAKSLEIVPAMPFIPADLELDPKHICVRCGVPIPSYKKRYCIRCSALIRKERERRNSQKAAAKKKELRRLKRLKKTKESLVASLDTLREITERLTRMISKLQKE